MQPCLSECFFICVVRHIAVFPVKLRVLPQFIFNSRDPIVMGVTIEAGVLRQGTPLCVPSKGVRRTQKDCVCALGFVNDVSCLFFSYYVSVCGHRRGHQHRDESQVCRQRQERPGDLHQDRAHSRRVAQDVRPPFWSPRPHRQQGEDTPTEEGGVKHFRRKTKRLI